jgi:chromosomal replication initiation ATPase DnaA
MQTKLKPSDILDDIAVVFNRSVEEIVAPGRLEEFVMCRKIHVFVCYEQRISLYRVALSINRTKSLVNKQVRAVRRHFRDRNSKWMEVWREYEKSSRIWKQLQSL